MSTEPPTAAVLTIAEVAAYLRLSETTIWRWCRSGRLPAFRVGRSWRVKRDDMERLIAEGQREHDTTPPIEHDM